MSLLGFAGSPCPHEVVKEVEAEETSAKGQKDVSEDLFWHMLHGLRKQISTSAHVGMGPRRSLPSLAQRKGRAKQNPRRGGFGFRI